MPGDQPVKILFVCGGNTCRSPMAAALAQHMWGARVVAESGGIDAGRLPVSRLACRTVEDVFGANVSVGQSRDVEEVDLASFDRIVALDARVAEELQRFMNQDDDRLRTWSIADPFEGGRLEYAAAAEEIERELRRNEADLLTRSGGAQPAPQPPAQASSVVNNLRSSIARWRASLAATDPGPTQRAGIVTKAFDQLFVPALVKRLSDWLVACALSPETIQSYLGSDRPMEKSPFGDVVRYLKKSRELAPRLRDVFSDGAMELLDPLPSLRNGLVKPEDYQAPSVAETLDALQNLETLLDATTDFFEPVLPKVSHPFGPGVPPHADSLDTELLGAKGSWLARAAGSGIPVPPGFVITTALSKDAGRREGLADQLEKAIARNMVRLEQQTGKSFGSTANPLLVSVRAGARKSMPGLADTVLNIGMNDEVVAAITSKIGNERFAWDSYRRLIEMFSVVVLGIDREAFEDDLRAVVLETAKTRGSRVGGYNFEEISSTLFDAEDLQHLVKRYRETVLKHSAQPFPADPMEQLRLSILAVFRSWHSPRASSYRRMYAIPDDWGTAAIVQAMVFGNLGEASGTGVAFTRDPRSGEKMLFGEWMPDAQGNDVVSGVREAFPVAKTAASNGNSLEERMPAVYQRLVDTLVELEQFGKDMQDVEFTIERGELFILQSRAGKRTPAAAAKIAVDLVDEKVISARIATTRFTHEDLPQIRKQLCAPRVAGDRRPDAIGSGVFPGAVAGHVALGVEEAIQMAEEGRPVILAGIEFSHDHLAGIQSAEGLLTTRGGLTSHAAVLARGLGIPCVVGCSAIEIDVPRHVLRIGDHEVREGDMITLDGEMGAVYIGECRLQKPDLPTDLRRLLEWKSRWPD